MRKPDSNEREIVAALEAVGATVERIESADGARRGVPDLACGFRGVTYLLEVKRPPSGPRGGGAGKLSVEQQAFIASWAGGKVAVVHTAQEALEAIGLEVQR